MVKKLLIFIGTIIFIIIVIIGLGIFKNNNFKYKKILLNYEELNLQPKKNELDINYMDYNILYSSVIDMTYGDLGKTLSIVIYNFDTKENTIIKFNQNKRIIDYVIKDDKIYYVTIGYEDNHILWNLYVSDLQFANNKILKNGNISTAFEAPNILISEDNIYIVTLDNDQYEFSLIDDDEIKQLFAIDATKNQLLDLEKVTFKGDLIYFISTDKIEQGLYSYDFKSNKLSTIYSNKNKNSLIYEYECTNNYYVINVIENNESTLIYKYDNEIVNEEQEIVLTFLRKINDNKFITHNVDNTFRIFDNRGNNISTLKFEESKLYPKYEIYDGHILIVQDQSNELYTYELNV